MYKKKRLILTEGNIFKQLMLLIYPIVFTGFFQALKSIADSIVAGHYLGTIGLSVIGGSSGRLINLYVGFVAGIIGGSMVKIASAIGRNDEEKIKKIIANSIILGVIISFIFSFVYIVFSYQLLTISNVPKDTLKESMLYLIISTTSFIPYYIFTLLVSILKATGENIRPNKYMIYSYLINFILMFILVAVFHIGYIGIALSFAIVQFVMMVYLIICVNKEFRLINYIKKYDWELLVELLKLGLPYGLQSILFNFAIIVVQVRINELGSFMVAANSINAQIENIFWIIMTGIGFAITTFVAANYSAGNIKRIRVGVLYAFKISALITVFISIFNVLFCRQLASLFSSDITTINDTVKIIRFISPLLILYISIEIFNGVLRGLGKSLFSTVITLFLLCIFRIVYLLFIKDPSIENILIIYPISWFLASVAFAFNYLHLKQREWK
ncbi:MAG: MATE family efflux transporter [Erysipelotrichaceae bacterium]|nr:MATE family efflux transporter [Erysipelotrichaceae bacterium]